MPQPKPPRSSEPFTITIQSSQSRLEIREGELNIELRLQTSYRFSSAHYVRLLTLTGLEGAPVFVHTSFAALAPFDSSFRRHLGISTSLPSAPALIDGGFISALSTISLAKLDGTVFEEIPTGNIVIVLQVAQAEWFQ